MNKRFALVLVLVLASSGLIVVGSVSGAATPSVPDFTLKVAAHPYTVTPSKTVDPYTGAVTTYPSYIVENKSIEVTIKNQLFTSYQMADGNWSRLYYNLRFKGHFASDDDWLYYPRSPSPPQPGGSGYINASLSEYTVISLNERLYCDLMRGRTDFQVQALIGYDEAKYAVSGNTGELFSYGNYFTGESSDWSNIQTLSSDESQAPTSSPSPSQNPTATPDQSNIEGATNLELNGVEIAILTVLIVIAVLLSISVALRLKKKQ